MTLKNICWEMSDDNSDDNDDNDDEIEDGSSLPIIMLDIAEESFNSGVKKANPDELNKVVDIINKARLLAFNFYPDIKAMFDKAMARLEAGASEGKVPPGSSAVQASRVNMRFVLSCLCILGAKVASALKLQEGNDETLRLLREALIFYPRSITANYLLARALLPFADSVEALERIEYHLRRAAAHQLPSSKDEDVVKEKESQSAARELLSLLLCQAGKVKEAYKYLRAIGFTWRLSKQVLAYDVDKHTKPVNSSAYVKGKDNCIPESALRHLRHVFRPESPFWKEHSYDLSCNASRVAGYFSYKYPLRERSALGSVEQIVDLVYGHVEEMFPQVKRATIAEWWVHSRPHASGHQLHFDSDETRIEEGGKPRHPICSCILYLEESGKIGGPTLVTDQTLGGGIASKGWLCFPRNGRLVAFDAKYLHGVIPGHGPNPAPGKRRLTFMVGFWDNIEAKDRGIDNPGPGQPWPGSESNYSWHKEMQVTPKLNLEALQREIENENESKSKRKCINGENNVFGADFQYVERVWEPVDKDGSSSLLLEGMRLPEYTCMFQGF